MARRKKNDVHGWVVLDKPYEMTSTQAVGRMKRLFDTGKAGHAGTLDPLATGMLPIALGEATKTVPFVMEGRKIYRFAVRWGAETTTDDTEGEVVATSDHRPTEDEIDAILDDFEGEIEQVPPAFSAIKVNGERAYDLARQGEDVELAARTIIVHSLELVATIDADTSVFEAECGKGTYVRALARDMGRRLGTHGHVIDLRRLLVGPFGEADMVTLDELQDAYDSEDPETIFRFLTPVSAALSEIPSVNISPDQAARIRNGNPVILRGRDAPVEEEAVAVYQIGGELIAIGAVEHGELRPVRILHLG